MTQAASAVLVCAVEGTALTPEERAFYRDRAPAGLTIFGRNVPDPNEGLGELVRELQALRPRGAPPLLVAIDQEGGRVARLRRGFPDQGPALGLEGGRTDAAALAAIERYATTMAGALRALGVNVDFAPVCDVLTRPENHAIGDRAFATTPDAAAARAHAFLRGLQAGGVLGCLKHFPGQGDAGVDTHAGRAVIDRSLEELEERELVPFRRLLPDATMVMIAHCIYPQLAPEEASRSPAIIQGLLRERMGFGGVVVSDDMNMGAIPQEDGTWEAAIVETVAAGGDMLLVCRHLERYERAHAALCRAAERDGAFAARLEDAARRVTALRGRLVG